MDNLDEFGQELLREAVRAIKSSNDLPQAGDEHEYYSSFSGFQCFCSKMGTRLNNIIDNLLQFEDTNIKWPPHDSTDTEELFDVLVENNDWLLEQVSSLLDESCKPPKEKESTSNTVVNTDVASWNKSELTKPWKYSVGNILRPQTKFRDIIDNSPTPFIPLLFNKPNHLKPLPSVYNKLQTPSSLKVLIENSKEWSTCPERCVHPYLYEIQHCELTAQQTTIKDPIPSGSLTETPLIMVTTYDQLQDMIRELSSVTEFAVDLEHHSYRSYQGLVCLMQVSTRSTDYIVDTLELRHCMQELNTVFTDPNIVKVFHGADWDICWLQRDFALYVVNLFDTGQASRVLQLPKYSLAFLLEYCCDVKADKQYQLADWRIRPLPQEMIDYARSDTHYLLYVYDRMRNELIRRSNTTTRANLLMSVIDRSKDVAMKTYSKPIVLENDYLKLCRKFKKSLNQYQLNCLKLLYEWRDQTARQEDESPGYVLPNHMLFQISEVLPREPQGVMACCNPVPILLRQHLNEVHGLVKQAKEVQSLPAVALEEEPVYVEEEVDTEMELDIHTEEQPKIEDSSLNKYNVTIITSSSKPSKNNNDPNKKVKKPLSSPAVREHLDKLRSKYRGILDQYMPTNGSISQEEVEEKVEQEIVFKKKDPVAKKQVKKKAGVKRPLVPGHSPQTKKHKPDDDDVPVPVFEYTHKGFSKAVNDTVKPAKNEYFPREVKTKSGPRSFAKMKSLKSTTSVPTKQTAKHQWPNK